MSASILDAAEIIEATSRETKPRSLAACTEELAALRFLVILTARWEASDSLEREYRKLMRRDLAHLRRRYSDRIDEIAMSFGVQPAMDAKEDVERNVVVPRGMRPPEPILEEDNHLSF